MVTVEVIRPEPIQNEVVIRMTEREARELMNVLMNDLIWDQTPYGETTIRAVYQTLEDAGITEA